MIDGRTTRHPGCTLSERIRKRVEEIFGWAKTTGDFHRTRLRAAQDAACRLRCRRG